MYFIVFITLQLLPCIYYIEFIALPYIRFKKKTLFIVWYRAAIATKNVTNITRNPLYPTLFTVHPKQ